MQVIVEGEGEDRYKIILGECVVVHYLREGFYGGVFLAPSVP